MSTTSCRAAERESAEASLADGCTMCDRDGGERTRQRKGGQGGLGSARRSAVARGARLVRAGARAGGDARGARGAELGGVVARRRNTVFDARERAYHLYVQHGDPADAARMATWLAADSLDFRGAPATANGWLRRAERLLGPLEECSDHGWLAFHAGYVAHSRGDTVRAWSSRSGPPRSGDAARSSTWRCSGSR